MIMNLFLVLLEQIEAKHFIVLGAALLTTSVFSILLNKMRNKTVQKNYPQHAEQRNEKMKQSDKPNKTQTEQNKFH